MRHLLLALLLVVMTGCGSDTKPEDQPTAPEETVSSPETPNGSDEPSAKAVVPVVNSIGMRFVPIQAGTFTMSKDHKAHQVTLTQAFELGQHEVTQEQYEAVMGTTPSQFKGSQNPVEQFSWNDAVEFCRKLSELPAEKKAGYVYRLPTEAEWEYACRAGTTTKYSFGDDASKLEQYAWYDKNSDRRTHPVGQKKPNAWGLYDMHGNVQEWCQDWLGDYPSGSITDPTGPASGIGRVLRGGAINDQSWYVRSATRNYSQPDLRSNFYGCLGFRLARTYRLSPDKQVASPAAKAPANKAVAAKTPDAATVKEPDPKPDKLRFSPVGHNRNLLLTLKGHSNHVLSVTFSPDGKRIASSGYDQTVKVWDSETGEEKLTIKKAHSREITTVLFSPDGKRILTQSRFANKRIKVWDAKTGQQLLANTDYGYYGDCAALSPDGKLIAMGDFSKIRVCDSKTGEEVLVTGTSGSKECVGFSPDGKWIVAGYGRQIGVWDAETGEKHKFYGGHTDEISDVEFSPDGKRIASSSDDGAKPIKVWDFETGKELFTLEISDPNNVSFSSDGKRIVSSGYSTIKVWDSKTGKIILTLRPNDQEGRVGAPMMCVAISPDGNRIVSGGHGDPGEGDIDAIVKVWNISGIKPGSKPKADKPPAQAADADSVVEKAIRRELKKPEGEITKADLEKVTELNFALAGTKITDAVLKEVAKCKQLKLLNFNAGQITAEGLKEVAKLQKLETLGLSSTGVTDAGLKEVAKCTQLTFLNLMNTKITDAGLREVMKLQKLNDLTLAYNNITGAGLKELAKLNQLRHLWLDGTKVTKADVTELQKALPKCDISGP